MIWYVSIYNIYIYVVQKYIHTIFQFVPRFGFLRFHDLPFSQKLPSSSFQLSITHWQTCTRRLAVGASFLLRLEGRERQRRGDDYSKPTCPQTHPISFCHLYCKSLAIFHINIGSLAPTRDFLEADEGPPLRFHVPNRQEVDQFFQRWPGARAKVTQQSLAVVWFEIM